MSARTDRIDANAPVMKHGSKVKAKTQRKDTSGGAGDLPRVSRVKKNMELTHEPGRHSTFREEPNRHLNEDGRLNKDVKLPRYKPVQNVSAQAQSQLLVKGSLWMVTGCCYLNKDEPPVLCRGGDEIPKGSTAVFLGAQRGDYKDAKDRRIRATQYLFLVAGIRCEVKNFYNIRPDLDDDDDED